MITPSPNFSTSDCNVFSSSGCSDSNDDFQKLEFNPRQSRHVYLLTYTKANAKKFPLRRCF